MIHHLPGGLPSTGNEPASPQDDILLMWHSPHGLSSEERPHDPKQQPVGGPVFRRTEDGSST